MPDIIRLARNVVGKAWPRVAARTERGRQWDRRELEGPFDLRGAVLRHADLNGAHLEDAILNGAHLEGAFLLAVHLEGADLRGAYLEGADLREAHLEGADLSRAKGLTQAQVDAAFGDAETELPEGLTRPAHWTQPEPNPEPAA